MKKFYNNNTKTLIIPHYYGQKIKNIPKETQIIIFEENFDLYELSLFNHPINSSTIKINNLICGNVNTSSFSNLNNLTHLTFGWFFNQSVDKLPKNLIHLTLGHKFNKTINKLPKKLTH